MIKLVELGDVSESIMGQAPPGESCNKEGTGYPFVKAGEFGDKRPIIREWTVNPLKIAKTTDVLLCVVGATAGKLNLGCDCAIGRSVAAIRPFESLLDQIYLYYYLQQLTRRLRAASQGSAQGVITREMIARLLIPLPPLEIQKQIAAILEKADNLRKQSQQMGKELDALAQSVYLEMFGDPVVNHKKFPVCTIRDIVSSVNYGTSEKASESNAEFPILRMNNITYEGFWDFSSLKYIDLEDSEKEKYLAKKGDLLFNRTNSKELVGKTAVFREDKEMAIAGYLIRVRFNEKANSEYVSAYLNSAHGKATLQHMCKSIVGMANINAQELQDIQILLPPKELQDKYALFVNSLLHKKNLFLKLYNEINSLFNVLIHKSFNKEFSLKLIKDVTNSKVNTGHVQL